MEPSPIEQPLSAGADSLNRLVEEHRRYSRKLEAMLSQSFLSQSEQLEAIRLKKLKLKLKDELERYAHPSTRSS